MLIKRDNKRGFTLAELLVVVAIIGVLVAVSIPIFTSQTAKAKAATDMANVRAAKAAAVADYLSDMPSGDSTTYYYDAASGTVTTDPTKAASFKGYGKSTRIIKDKYNTNDAMGEGTPYENDTAHIVKIVINNNEIINAVWDLGTSTGEQETQTTTSASAEKTVTIQGTDGKSYTFTATQSWDDLKKNSQYSITIDKGLIFYDATGIYLLYGDQNNIPGDSRELTAAQIQEKYPDKVMSLSQYSGKIFTIADTEQKYSDTVWKTIPKKGTLCYFNSSYYVAAVDIGSIYVLPPGGWVKVLN